MPSIVTIIKDYEDINFILDKEGNKINEVIVLTTEGWYSINDENARFMELLR